MFDLIMYVSFGWLHNMKKINQQVTGQLVPVCDLSFDLYTCNYKLCEKRSFKVWATLFLSLRAPTENGLSLMAQWMPCGLRIWTQYSTTTRNCVWWVARSFRCPPKWASSLSPWTWRWHLQPQWEAPLLWFRVLSVGGWINYCCYLETYNSTTP